MKTLSLLILILLTSCGLTDPENTPDSTYPQLQGTYTYYNYQSWNSGLYETSTYASYDFDSTAVAWSYFCHWSYLENTGWVNALKDGSGYDMEWEVSGSTFRERLYDNEYSSWSSYSFQWVDDNHVKINGLTYTKD